MILWTENIKSINASYIEAVNFFAIAVTAYVHSAVEFLADLLAHGHHKIHAIVIVLTIIFRNLFMKVTFLNYL